MNAATTSAIYDVILPGWREATRNGKNRRVCAPYRDDKNPSLDVHETKLTWFDRGIGEGGGAVDLARRVLGEEGARSLLRELGDKQEDHAPTTAAPKLKPQVEVMSGATSAQIAALKRSRRLRDGATLDRIGAKTLRVRWPEDDGGWQSWTVWVGLPTLVEGGFKLWALNKNGIPRLDDRGKLIQRNVGPVSFFLSPAAHQRNGGTIQRLFDVEGESDAIACIDSGVPHVVASSGGAGSLAAHERHREFLLALEPDEVVVIRDLDDAGRAGAAKVAEWWLAQGITVRIVELPEELGDKGDLRDFLNGRPARDGQPAVEPIGGAAQLHTLADAAPKRERATSAKLESEANCGGSDQDIQLTLCNENLTDSGNALRFYAMHREWARFVYERNEWATFDGSRWIFDGLRTVQRMAYETARAISAAAESLPDDRRRKLQEHSLKLESAAAIRRMLELAAPRLQVRAADFDQPRHLLNCPNGTFDLHTLKMRPPDPDDLLTKITAAVYDPSAVSELWQRVLEHAIPDPLIREYLQRLAGLTLDASIMLDLAILIHGPTRTAKGTVQSAIHGSFGDYAVTAGLEDFADRKPQAGRATPELVRLQGVRMVSVYETSARLRLDAALVKTLSGSDPITVRDLYCRAVTYLPQFTLWLATNCRPSVPSDDDALWERLREIPFNEHLKPEERKPSFRADLSDPKKHGAAVLAWAVEGLRRYRESGLTTPDGVVQAGADYRAEMDPLTDFFGDCLVFEPGAKITSSQLASAYSTWCQANSERPRSTKKLAAALTAKGCEGDRSRDQDGKLFRFWSGVRHA